MHDIRFQPPQAGWSRARVDVELLRRDAHGRARAEGHGTDAAHERTIPRQGHQLGHDVRPATIHGPDMGGLDLSAAAAIDQLQPGYRAARIIGLDNTTAEQAVTDQS